MQLLDGVGAGIWGAITPLVLADLMRGTGRYNIAQGGLTTAQGIGASLSGLAAGVIVDHLGYSAAFLTSAVVAALAFVALAVAMPETRPAAEPHPQLRCRRDMREGVRQARPSERTCSR
jgi:MFS family permease